MRLHPEQVSDTLLELLDMTEERLSVENEARADLRRTRLFDEVEDAFEEYDLLALPTMANRRTVSAFGSPARFRAVPDVPV